MTKEDILNRLIDACEALGGVWIDPDEIEGVRISLKGFCELTALGETYVDACLLLEAPIVAEYPYGGGTIPFEEARRLARLPRSS